MTHTMRIKVLPVSFSIYLLLMLAVAPAGVYAHDSHRSISPNIYDESANGAKQISDALLIAKKEHKHILLDFGANWCIWCHRLHTLFETNKEVAEELKSAYVVVMIDTNGERNKDI